MDLAFAFDVSSSMRPYVEQVRTDAIAIINAVAAESEYGPGRIGWVNFGGTSGDPNNHWLSEVSDQSDGGFFSTKVDTIISLLLQSQVETGPDVAKASIFSGLSYALAPGVGPWDPFAETRKLVVFTDTSANDEHLAEQVAAYAADLGYAWNQTVGVPSSGRVQAHQFELVSPEQQVFSLQIFTVLVGEDPTAAIELQELAHSNRGEFYQALDYTPYQLAGEITGSSYNPLADGHAPPSLSLSYSEGELVEGYEDLITAGTFESNGMVYGSVVDVVSEGVDLTEEQREIFEKGFGIGYPIGQKWGYYVPYDSPNHTGFSFLDDGQSVKITIRFTAVDEKGAFAQATQELVIKGTDDYDHTYDVVGNGEANELQGTKYGEFIDAGDGDDFISGLLGHDWLAGGSGKDTFRDNAKGLNGDRITDLSAEDRIEVTGQHFGQAALTVEETPAGQVLKVDVPGQPDQSFKLKIEGGDHSGGEFLVGPGQGPEPSTSIFYVEHLPELREGVRVTDSPAEGIVQPGLLAGDGHAGLEVSLKADAKAQFQNTVGAYDIDENGVVSDVRVLFQNSHATSAPTAEIAPLEAGHQVGFFIVQDGFRFFNGGLPNDLKFIDAADGSQATVHDSLVLQSASLGRLDSSVVFHSYSDELNPDGRAHVLSGADKAGDAFLIGFEDLLANRSDFDFQDVILKVSAINADYAV